MASKVFLQFFALLNVAHCCMGLIIEPRSAWDAVAPKRIIRIRGPVKYVFIHHSNSEGCRDSRRCQELIRDIQLNHMDRPGFTDIGYNFIVAGDGKVYEGRGFGRVGSHATNYNSNSIGIAFLGDFESRLPSRTMLRNARAVITQAICRGYLKSDYTLLGHRQTKPHDLCPGTALHNEIEKWPEWGWV